MTPGEAPLTREVVFAEIGRTLLLIQPTEKLFNFVANAVIPDPPFTEEGLTIWNPNKRDEALVVLKVA
jgi:hypothetical protein